MLRSDRPATQSVTLCYNTRDGIRPRKDAMHIGNQQKVSTMESANRPKRIETPKPQVTTHEPQAVPATAQVEAEAKLSVTA
jgi:hypothetical protein